MEQNEILIAKSGLIRNNSREFDTNSSDLRSLTLPLTESFASFNTGYELPDSKLNNYVHVYEGIEDNRGISSETQSFGNTVKPIISSLGEKSSSNELADKNTDNIPMNDSASRSQVKKSYVDHFLNFYDHFLFGLTLNHLGNIVENTNGVKDFSSYHSHLLCTNCQQYQDGLIDSGENLTHKFEVSDSNISNSSKPFVLHYPLSVSPGNKVFSKFIDLRSDHESSEIFKLWNYFHSTGELLPGPYHEPVTTDSEQGFYHSSFFFQFLGKDSLFSRWFVLNAPSDFPVFQKSLWGIFSMDENVLHEHSPSKYCTKCKMGDEDKDLLKYIHLRLLKTIIEMLCFSVEILPKLRLNGFKDFNETVTLEQKNPDYVSYQNRTQFSSMPENSRDDDNGCPNPCGNMPCSMDERKRSKEVGSSNATLGHDEYPSWVVTMWQEFCIFLEIRILFSRLLFLAPPPCSTKELFANFCENFSEESSLVPKFCSSLNSNIEQDLMQTCGPSAPHERLNTCLSSNSGEVTNINEFSSNCELLGKTCFHQIISLIKNDMSYGEPENISIDMETLSHLGKVKSSCQTPPSQHSLHRSIDMTRKRQQWLESDSLFRSSPSFVRRFIRPLLHLFTSPLTFQLSWIADRLLDHLIPEFSLDRSGFRQCISTKGSAITESICKDEKNNLEHSTESFNSWYQWRRSHLARDIIHQSLQIPLIWFRHHSAWEDISSLIRATVSSVNFEKNIGFSLNSNVPKNKEMVSKLFDDFSRPTLLRSKEHVPLLEYGPQLWGMLMRLFHLQTADSSNKSTVEQSWRQLRLRILADLYQQFGIDGFRISEITTLGLANTILPNHIHSPSKVSVISSLENADKSIHLADSSVTKESSKEVLHTNASVEIFSFSNNANLKSIHSSGLSQVDNKYVISSQKSLPVGKTNTTDRNMNTSGEEYNSIVGNHDITQNEITAIVKRLRSNISTGLLNCGDKSSGNLTPAVTTIREARAQRRKRASQVLSVVTSPILKKRKTTAGPQVMSNDQELHHHQANGLPTSLSSQSSIPSAYSTTPYTLPSYLMTWRKSVATQPIPASDNTFSKCRNSTTKMTDSSSKKCSTLLLSSASIISVNPSLGIYDKNYDKETLVKNDYPINRPIEKITNYHLENKFDFEPVPQKSSAMDNYLHSSILSSDPSCASLLKSGSSPRRVTSERSISRGENSQSTSFLWLDESTVISI